MADKLALSLQLEKTVNVEVSMEGDLLRKLDDLPQLSNELAELLLERLKDYVESDATDVSETISHSPDEGFTSREMKIRE